MSTFTTPADLRMMDNYNWMILSPFEFHIGNFPSARIISVPVGTITDLASIPRLFWSIFPPHGQWAKAAIIHDYLYETGLESRYRSDKIFLEGMEVLKVPRITRYFMYTSVRIFGITRYNKK